MNFKFHGILSFLILVFFATYLMQSQGKICSSSEHWLQLERIAERKLERTAEVKGQSDGRVGTGTCVSFFPYSLCVDLAVLKMVCYKLSVQISVALDHYYVWLMNNGSSTTVSHRHKKLMYFHIWRRLENVLVIVSGSLWCLQILLLLNTYAILYFQMLHGNKWTVSCTWRWIGFFVLHSDEIMTIWAYILIDLGPPNRKSVGILYERVTFNWYKLNIIWLVFFLNSLQETYIEGCVSSWELYFPCNMIENFLDTLTVIKGYWLYWACSYITIWGQKSHFKKSKGYIYKF